MKEIHQPRTFILGLGDFGLRSQVYLWKRLRYAIESRRERHWHLAPVENVLGFLTLRVDPGTTALGLYRPSVDLWNSFQKKYGAGPFHDNLDEIYEETMERCPLGEIYNQPSDSDTMTRHRGSIFRQVVDSRNTLLQQFREALLPIMQDTAIWHERQAQLHVIVIADAAKELDSALLWPTLAILQDVLREFMDSTVSVFLKTGSYAHAPLSTGERAIAYVSIQELEFFANSEQHLLVPDFLRALLPDQYWAAHLGHVLFDHCYLLDNAKQKDHRSVHMNDVIVTLGNAIEMLVLTSLQQSLDEYLGPDETHFHTVMGRYAPTGGRVAGDSYEKINVIQETWEYPYQTYKFPFRRGVFSSLGAASISLPVEQLDSWGDAKMFLWFCSTYLAPALDDPNAFTPSPTTELTGVPTPCDLQDTAGWMQRRIAADGRIRDMAIRPNTEKTALDVSWTTTSLNTDELWANDKLDANTWVDKIDDLWKQSEPPGERPKRPEGTLANDLEVLKSLLGKEDEDSSDDNLDAQWFNAQVEQYIDLYGQHILNLLLQDNSGLVRALALMKILRTRIKQKSDDLDTQVAALTEQESKLARRRRDEREKFIAGWSEQSRAMNIAGKLHSIEASLDKMTKRMGWRLPHVLTRTGRNMLRGQKEIESLWNGYYTTTMNAASVRYSIEINKMLKEQFCQQLDLSLGKMESALLASLNELKERKEEAEKSLIYDDNETAHFLRTSQEIDSSWREERFAEWGGAIINNIQEHPLLGAHAKELSKHIESLRKKSNDHEKVNYGEIWAKRLVETLKQRINTYKGSWFTGKFILEDELKNHTDDLEQEIRSLRERSQPFVRIESDIFDHETVSYEFFSIDNHTNSNEIVRYAEKIGATTLSSFDPYTITYLRTVHGLNVLVLPFVEYYRKEFQRLNEEDRKRLMLLEDMDETKYGFARKVPEIQLKFSVFDVNDPWILPAKDEEGSEENDKMPA